MDVLDRAEGHPTPDPFYVDQAKASLLQLEALDVPNQCELRYAQWVINIDLDKIWINFHSKKILL